MYICEICGTKNSDEKICVNLCKSVGLFPTSGGICNDRTGRICEICVTKKQIYTDDSPRFYTFYLVISLFNHTFASNFEVVHF